MGITFFGENYHSLGLGSKVVIDFPKLTIDCLGFPQLLAIIFFPQDFLLSIGVGFLQVFQFLLVCFVEYY